MTHLYYFAYRFLDLEFIACFSFFPGKILEPFHCNSTSMKLHTTFQPLPFLTMSHFQESFIFFLLLSVSFAFNSLSLISHCFIHAPNFSIKAETIDGNAFQMTSRMGKENYLLSAPQSSPW